MDVAAIIPDCHIPYEDKKCFNAMLLALQDIKPKEIVILGDFADFYAVNSHGKHPEAQHLLIDEIDQVNQRLDMIDALFPQAKKVFLEGNHCYRLERYLTNNAPAVFGITTIKYLFRLNQRPKWLFLTYNKTQKHNVLGTSLIARHEPFSMSSAKASLTKCNSSLVYGHIHRREEYWHKTLDGRQLVNFSPGWLGDERHDKVFGYAFPNWQKGFALVRAKKGSKEFVHEIIGFDSKKRCIVEGKIYEA